MFWFTFSISIEELQIQATGHLKTDLSMEESGTKEDFVSVQRHWPMGNVFFFSLACYVMNLPVFS